MQYQFATEGAREATKSHSTLVNTQAEIFRTTPFMPSLGNLDRKLRPKGINRTEVDGWTYYNSSVRGNGTFGSDPKAAFLDKAASYKLITLDRDSGTMTVAIKALDDSRVVFDTKDFHFIR
jgi:hypothetical protein